MSSTIRAATYAEYVGRAYRSLSPMCPWNLHALAPLAVIVATGEASEFFTQIWAGEALF